MVSEGADLLRGGGVVIKTIEKGIVFTLLFCLECLRIIMSDVWSRAWCETQKIPNFAVKGKNFYYLVSNLNSILLAGITPSNEVRDAPNYLRPISSEPTEHDSTCELSRSPSPDMSGILCYKLRKKK